MREGEANVEDEEGRTEEAPSSSITIPPDHLRCLRRKGQEWRCKGWKFNPSVTVYCEHHYNLRLKEKQREKEMYKVTPIMEHHHHHHQQVIEKKLVSNQRIQKRRRYTDFTVFSSTRDNDEEDEDDDNFILSKKSRISTMDSKEMEKYSISELITYLKSSFRKQEFENVEKILQMREDKMKMEKQEAENRRAQFKQKLGILKTTCRQRMSEVEIKCLDIQDELERCKRKKDYLKAKVGHLEKKLKTVTEQERRSEEGFTKMSWELERKNRDLETEKRRAECETEVWKKRFDQLEAQILMEPRASQASRKIYEEPRGSQFNVYCSKEGKKNESENWRLEGLIGMEATKHDRGFYAPANSDSISHSLTRARVPDQEAKKCENEQTKTQSETSCVLKGSCAPNLKEALNCGGRIYASTKVNLDCCFPSGENRVTQPAGVTKKSESKQIEFQTEANRAMDGATLSQIIIKKEALNCDEKLCTSSILDSICNSARGKNSQESPLSRQSSVSPIVSQERKVSGSTQTKFWSEASCALSGVKLSHVKIKEEPFNCDKRISAFASADSASHSIISDNVKVASTSRSRSILLQQFEQKSSTAEQMLSKQFEIIGTSCKQPRNSTAENDSEKDAKKLGADCDGISAFLCEIRRLKANKPNLTLKHI